MQHMEKASLYNVDGNRVATAKQIYAVARHFGKLQSKTATETYKLTKVFGAILMKFNAENSETPITHGDIARFFELKKVPAKFIEKITTKAPKAKKTKAQPSKEVSIEKLDEEIQFASKEVDEFVARLNAIDSRISTVEKSLSETKAKMATMDTKLEILMAWLETNPDA